MSKNIIDDTAVFICSKGIGVSFSPIPSQMIAKGEGKSFLNENTKCVTKGVGQCILQPNPSGAGFLPCNQTKLPITPWSGTDNIISIAGAKALTSETSTMCPLGAKISLQDNCDTLFKVGCDMTITEIVMDFANEKLKNIKKSKVLFNDEKNKYSNDTLCDNDFCNKPIYKGNFTKEKSDSANLTSNKYALCPYEQCNSKNDCSYFCAKPELDNNSAELKRQFERDRFQEYSDYINVHNRLRGEYPEYGWGYEGHHIISGNQVFMARESNGDLKYGHLLKLAYMCGYDINNAKNCILLPSMARREGPWGCLDEYVKEAKAFDVMDIMKKQWHLGGHAYSISKDSLKYYKPTEEQLLSSEINEYFPNYATSVKAKLTKINDIYSRSLCWKERNSREFRYKFIKRLNAISEEIEQALLSFEKKPKNSFPYFVSKQSVDYAYDAPKTGKVVILYKQGNNIYASKFRVSRKQKNNCQVIITQNPEEPNIRVTKDTMFEFVKYCENIMHFWIDNRIEKDLPWDCTKEFISKREIDEKNINDYAIKYSMELFTFINKNEIANQGQLAQIRRRWKEVKENVDFYN